jgi:hypothetical protein
MRATYLAYFIFLELISNNISLLIQIMKLPTVWYFESPVTSSLSGTTTFLVTLFSKTELVFLDDRPNPPPPPYTRYDKNDYIFFKF